MATKIGNKALIPNPALKAFNVLVGKWQTTGSHPQVPGVTFHGRTSFDWMEGGAFLIMRSEIKEPNFPAGVAIFGSDDACKTYFMLYFDERGISRKYDVTMKGNKLKWQRDDPKFAQRFTIAIDKGGKKMTGKGEMSKKGADWEKDISLNYEQVK